MSKVWLSVGNRAMGAATKSTSAPAPAAAVAMRSFAPGARSTTVVWPFRPVTAPMAPASSGLAAPSSRTRSPGLMPSMTTAPCSG